MDLIYSYLTDLRIVDIKKIRIDLQNVLSKLERMIKKLIRKNLIDPHIKINSIKIIKLNLLPNLFILGKMKIITKSAQRDLTKTQKIKIFDAFQAQFDELDIYIVAIQREHPEWIDQIFKEYTRILGGKINPHQTIEVYPISLFSQTNWNIIQTYEHELDQLQRAMLSFLAFDQSPLCTKKFLEREDTIEVPFNNYVRFGYYHIYYIFHAILNLKGKKVTYNLAKQIAEEIYAKPRPNRKKFADLPVYMEWLGSNCLATHDFTIAELEDKRIIMHVQECMWGEALKDVEDPELMYFLICYGDFFSTSDHNENFVLTRKKTILQNHGICDFCYHHQQKGGKITHPDETFWNSV